MGFFPKQYQDHLEANDANLGKLSTADKAKVCNVAWCSNQKRLQHHVDPDGFTMYYKYRNDLFGSKRRFEAINRHKFIEVEEVWSKQYGFTKIYRLKPELQVANDSFFREHTGPFDLIDEKGRALRKVKRRRAIRSVDSIGNPARSINNLSLQFAVPVNVDSLRLLVEELKLWEGHLGGETGRPRTEIDRDVVDKLADKGLDETVRWLDRCIRQSEKILAYAHTTVLLYGYIAQEYEEKPAGRLYSSGLTLQTVHGLVRRAATDDCYEYDFANCHYTILHHLAKQEGLVCSTIIEYLNNKQRIRQEIAQRIGVSIKQVKQALISLIYGAPVSAYWEGSLKDIMGDQCDLFLADQFVESLHQDVKDARNLLVGRHRSRTHKGKIINALHKSIDPDRKPREILAHILQGMEARMLEICREVMTKTVLLQHDGWTCQERQDKELMEQRILETTRIPMSIEEEFVTLYSRNDETSETLDTQGVQLHFGW
jgi:hypothetical protein